MCGYPVLARLLGRARVGRRRRHPGNAYQISVALPAFDRSVFVISVLERYSDQECSLLLNCTRADVMAARIRAIQQIGKSADRYGDVDSIGPYGESSPSMELNTNERSKASMGLSASRSRG